MLAELLGVKPCAIKPHLICQYNIVTNFEPTAPGLMLSSNAAGFAWYLATNDCSCDHLISAPVTSASVHTQA